MVMIRGRRFPKIFPPGSGFKNGQGKEWEKNKRGEKTRKHEGPRRKRETTVQDNQPTNDDAGLEKTGRAGRQTDRRTDRKKERRTRAKKAV